MPLCTVHLITLTPSTTIPQFLSALTSHAQPIIASRPIRWIIVPAKFSPGPVRTVPPPPPVPWHLMLILPGTSGLPSPVASLVSSNWALTSGVPSSLLKDFPSKNDALLHPRDVPTPTGSLDQPLVATNTQALEMSSELLEWCLRGPNTPKGAVSMLNLLAFKKTPGAHENYAKYGKAFADSVGIRRGGVAKIVGRVVENPENKADGTMGWDEIALAHYPSTVHFADMVASRDYQEANQTYRVDSLEDTCILCTSELVLEDEIRKAGMARL